MDMHREVAREVLLEILRDAHAAPTHGLTQPWRFHVFTGAARSGLGDALQAIYDRVTPLAERKEDKRAKLGATPRLSPVVIAVAAHVVPGGKIPEVEELLATACSVQNLMLSAHMRELGSYWSTPAVAMTSEFGAWLGLDSDHHPLGLIYLGYPSPAARLAPASMRHALEEHVVFHDS